MLIHGKLHCKKLYISTTQYNTKQLAFLHTYYTMGMSMLDQDYYIPKEYQLIHH